MKSSLLNLRIGAETIIGRMEEAVKTKVTVQLFSALTFSVKMCPETERSFNNTNFVKRGQPFDVPFQNPENLAGRRDV